jgi:hypothetical protein
VTLFMPPAKERGVGVTRNVIFHDKPNSYNTVIKVTPLSNPLPSTLSLSLGGWLHHHPFSVYFGYIYEKILKMPRLGSEPGVFLLSFIITQPLSHSASHELNLGQHRYLCNCEN